MKWKISHLLYLLAVIALVIGIIVGIGVGSKNGSDLDENDEHNVTRTNFFLLAAIALAAVGWLQMGYEKMHHHHKMSMSV